ncbi:hypothetical protein E2562_031901 [Oryza meyeriana var. granulata]|uniref:Uncharacterized protein n=1 Tax=Oryza meyeriana var. granulata TaxID=110450 RepID=A0A6G1D9S8_9ORYZ|nr:hypothetical protein E2562_031901 [Oryza meyeriana var. granulata]
MATVRSALRKQLSASDRCYVDGNLRSAKMHADMAAAFFSSVPEAQCAQATYRDKLGSKTDHYAILGVKLSGCKPDAATHDAVMK